MVRLSIVLIFVLVFFSFCSNEKFYLKLYKTSFFEEVDIRSQSQVFTDSINFKTILSIRTNKITKKYTDTQFLYLGRFLFDTLSAVKKNNLNNKKQFTKFIQQIFSIDTFRYFHKNQDSIKIPLMYGFKNLVFGRVFWIPLDPNHWDEHVSFKYIGYNFSIDQTSFNKLKKYQQKIIKVEFDKFNKAVDSLIISKGFIKGKVFPTDYR